MLFEALEPRQLLSATPVGPEFQVGPFTTTNEISPKVASDAAGDFVVVWQVDGKDGDGYGVYAQLYNSAGVAQGSAFQVNSYTAGNQERPSVAMDSAGDFVIAWQSYDQPYYDQSLYGIYAQRYNAAGAPQGSEFLVNTNYTTGNQEQPSVAMDSAGDFVIAWRSYPGYTIFAQQYNAAGVPQTPTPIPVTPNNTATQSVAMDSAGDFVVVWQDNSASFVEGQRFDSTGAEQGGEFQISVVTPGQSAVPSVAMDSAGDFAVAWRSNYDEGSGAGIDAIAYGSNGTAQTSVFHVNSYTTGAQTQPSVAMDAAGDFVVAWQSNAEDGSGYGIFAQQYTAGATANGSQFQVNTYTTNDQTFPAVAMDSTGDFVVAWQSYGQGSSDTDIYAEDYSTKTPPVVSTSGVIPNSDRQVNTYTTSYQDFPQVASDSAGDFVVVWQSLGQDGANWGIEAQRYNSAGLPTGSEFQVNTYTSGGQAQPTVAMDASGDFVVAWRSYLDGRGYGIFAQRYNAAGAPTGSEFEVSTNTSTWQTHPSVAMDAGGDFVVTWQGDQGKGLYNIYAQLYSAAGTAQGSVFQVAATGTMPAAAMDSAGDFVVVWQRIDDYISGQRYTAAGMPEGVAFFISTTSGAPSASPSVAMDAGGDFAVAWTSFLEDGSSSGIDARAFDSNGASKTNLLHVNSYTTGAQVAPAMAMDSAGDFMIVWESFAEDGSGYGIFAQKEQANGIASGSQFQVNTYTTGQQEGPRVAMDSAGDFVAVWESYQDGDDDGVFLEASYAGYTGLTYAPNSGPQAIDPFTLLSDSESNQIVSATITISSGYVPGEDVLGFATQNGISGSFDPSTGTLTLTGGASVADYQAALEAVTFEDTLSDSSTATRTVSFAVNDGIASSNTDTTTITLLPDVVTQLVFTTEPPSSVTSDSGFGITVSAEDAQGSVDKAFNGSATVALASDPAGGTLSGTLTATVSQGVAVFSGLSLDKAGSGYTLAVTSGTLTSAASSSISVTPGAATHLVISSQPPSSVISGSPFGFTVTAEDAQGNVDTNFNSSETVMLSSNPAGGTLGGTLVVTASAGVAAFSGLSLDKVGSGYTLAVTSGTLTSAASSSISVTPGAATQLIISSAPSSVISGSPFSFTVTAEDAQGNVDTDFNGSETVAISSNPAGGTLSGTLMVTASAGVAIFSGLSIDNVASGYTLGVTSAGLPTAKTGPIQVTPATLIINGSPGDVTTISLSDPTYFSVVIDGGTRTIYNSKNVDKVIYYGPASASELDYYDAVPNQVYTATQTFSSAVLTRGDGFELDSHDASSLYIYVADPASSATVDAGGGSDGSFFVGAPGASTSYLADPTLRIYGQLSGFSTVTVSGAADGTYAYLYSTSHASAVASPTHATITAGSVTDSLDSFRQVYVVGAADGTDTVTLDSAGGGFVGTPRFSYVAGSSAGGNFLLAALYAANVTAEAAGTSDTAAFYSYAGNAFIGGASNSSLGGVTTNIAGSNVRFFVQAIGYAVAAVYESGAGSDTAQLISSGGGNLISTDTATTLTTGGSTITVNSFFVSNGQIVPVGSQIAVTGSHDGTDTAYLYDSPGANSLVAGGSTATLTSSFKSISVDKFGTVYGEAQYGSDDTDKTTAAIDFVLQLVGSWTSA